MPSNRCSLSFAALLTLLFAGSAVAQSGGRWLDVQFPRDSPVLVVSFSLGPATTARLHGTSMALDLHASLTLRNTGSKAISGLTLSVAAQDLTPAGRGSVTVPSLHVQPGEVFPVRVDMELLRPFNLAKSDSAMVQVSLDCALFNDLSAYGPDKLDSRRTLTVFELQARRDRRYFATLLDTGRVAQLREDLNFGLQDLNPQQLGLELLREPRAASSHDQSLSVGTVSFPSAPVHAVSGAAHVSGNEVRAPQIQLKNTSQKSIRSLEMGWIVQDERGGQFVAGSVPAALELGPVQTGRMTETGILRFSRPAGQPMIIGALMAFVNDVQFADGNMWIPSRRDIADATSDPVLRRALSASPEQQRLADIYRRRGISGLAEELKKLN